MFAARLLPDEPILIVTLDRTLDVQAEFQQVVAIVRALLDASPEPVFCITEVSEEMRPDPLDLTAGANVLARGEAPLFRHPMIRQLIVVTTDLLLRTAVRGFNSEVFGYLDIKLFETLDEALAYCRAPE